jgi:hypothetical protein
MKTFEITHASNQEAEFIPATQETVEQARAGCIEQALDAHFNLQFWSQIEPKLSETEMDTLKASYALLVSLAVGNAFDLGVQKAKTATWKTLCFVHVAAASFLLVIVVNSILRH